MKKEQRRRAERRIQMRREEKKLREEIMKRKRRKAANARRLRILLMKNLLEITKESEDSSTSKSDEEAAENTRLMKRAIGKYIDAAKATIFNDSCQISNDQGHVVADVTTTMTVHYRKPYHTVKQDLIDIHFSVRGDQYERNVAYTKAKDVKESCTAKSSKNIHTVAKLQKKEATVVLASKTFETQMSPHPHGDITLEPDGHCNRDMYFGSPERVRNSSEERSFEERRKIYMDNEMDRLSKTSVSDVDYNLESKHQK